ncbi:hypothetical protein WELLINGTON_40 [Erwinia phage Wellington]|jgi:hypothetical protein|uniref:Uncharacterized protein n=2 Tax=Wellingtonvirus wellington TaxID=2734153 RepID=A0A1B2IDS2_9CAUD|nr:hypothetical protein BIZ80_gp259 [Erwinia phage vB_EamM_Kwan]YP_009806524.1 hypothetical protein HOT70_gp261 [Erwinia phage Wellington]ANZ49392.1 hypothetical protein KWAN_40 [Erwinia phage vB_EamM_Kwan]AXF51171.1 hypothetical protein WELLINGTON_40 [Erwinia phage Wellington]
MTPISTDRVFGHYPVSIASSLAIEGLTHTGEFASWGPKPPIHDYQVLYLNLRTLFRNAFYAFEDNRERLTPDVILTSIEEDIKNILAAASSAAPSMLCVPYLCQYNSVNKTFPEAAFRNANTPSQIFYNSLEQDVYKQVVGQQLWGVELFDCAPKGEHDTVLLTHMPSDLLARSEFPKLALIESHTGKLKTHLEWYTKVNGKSAQIPFNKAFLTLFGDGVMFHPLDRKVRSVVTKTAEKYHWTQTTTMDRINNCLRLVNEPHVVDYLRKLAR